MLDEMTDFRENQCFTGKLACFDAPGNAKQDGLFDDAGSSTGQQGSRIDFFKTELSKKGPKCRELLSKDWTNGLNGYIFVADARAAGDKDNLGIMISDHFKNRSGDGSGLVGNHLVPYNLVPFLFGPFPDPFAAFVVCRRTGA